MAKRGNSRTGITHLDFTSVWINPLKSVSWKCGRYFLVLSVGSNSTNGTYRISEPVIHLESMTIHSSADYVKEASNIFKVENE